MSFIILNNKILAKTELLALKNYDIYQFKNKPITRYINDKSSLILKKFKFNKVIIQLDTYLCL